jgi:phosphoribosylformylglycinamidine cyclo-ligase
VLTGANISPGDVILGLASSGVHSNGFSLVRRIIAERGWKLDDPSPSLAGRALGEALLAPTRIYVRSLLPLAQQRRIKGLAHITGGGLIENIPRVLPDNCHAVIDSARWELPPIFAMLQRGGGIADEEMVRTFNCGIGMAVIVDESAADTVSTALESAGETVHRIGRIEAGERGCTVTGEGWSAIHHA